MLRFKHYTTLTFSFWLIALINFMFTSLFFDFIIGMNLFLLFGFFGLVTMALDFNSINQRASKVMHRLK